MFNTHLDEFSDITLLEFPAILNNTCCVIICVIEDSINNPNSLAQKETILHASFINEERKSAN